MEIGSPEQRALEEKCRLLAWEHVQRPFEKIKSDPMPVSGYNKRAQVHLNLAKQRTHSELKLCTCNVALTGVTASGGLGDAACDPTQHQTHNLPIAVPAQATRVLQCHCQPSGRQTRHPLTCRAALRQSRCRALCLTSAEQQGLVQGLCARVCPR